MTSIVKILQNGLFFTLLFHVGCFRHEPEETPEGVAELFTQAIRESTVDPVAKKKVISMLDSPSRLALQERAKAFAVLTGRPVAEDMMLVTQWVGTSFLPERFVVGEKLTDTAVVTLLGADPKLQQARLKLVREGKVWRIHLPLPPYTRSAPSSSSSSSSPSSSGWR